MKKILVCGGAGFIGYHLLRRLSQDKQNEIHAVDNLSRGQLDFNLQRLLRRHKIRFIEADLTDAKSYDLLAQDYDYIYDLVALVGVKNVTGFPEKTLYVNICSILKLLEWIKNTNKCLKKLIFASTSEVYAGTFKHYSAIVPTDEKVNLTIDDITLPRSTYALSKIVGESACFNYYKKYKIPFVIVRYHNVYGPRMGCDHAIPELLLRAKRAKRYLGVYSLEHSRAFCYITDAIEATVGLAQARNCLGQIVNVGNASEEITVGSLAEKIIKLVNPRLRIKTLGDQEQSPVRRCPNVAKLQKIINFTPRISIDRGIRLTWDWYKGFR